MVASRVMVTGEGLQGPETSTHVSIRDGKRIVQDGPFAETKEMLGGFFVIDVPDLDAALVGALRTWPETGVPENPEAWLLKAARRRLIDEARHRAVQARTDSHLD